MNEELVQRLANPVYDVEEAQELMHLAGLEIIRLNQRLVYLNECILKLRDENDKLSLDLGLRERGYTQ
jgi:hypothetical protein